MASAQIFTEKKFYVSDTVEGGKSRLEKLVQIGGGTIFKRKPNKTNSNDNKLYCILGKEDRALYE